MTSKVLKKSATLMQGIEDHIHSAPQIKTIYIWKDDFDSLKVAGILEKKEDQFTYRGYKIKAHNQTANGA